MKKKTIYISFSVGFIESAKSKPDERNYRKKNRHALSPFANVIRKKTKVITRKYVFLRRSKFYVLIDFVGFI